MNCFHCGLETVNLKFCSRSCSAKSTNIGRVKSDASKEKISNALKGKIGALKGRTRPKYCTVDFHDCIECRQLISKPGRKTCSIECRDAVRSRNGTLKKRIRFHNPFDNTEAILQSNWEEDLAKWLCDMNIRWTRPTKPFSWFDTTMSKKRTYLPDFYLPEFNLYLDVKNAFKQQQDRDKLSQLTELIPLLVADKNEMKSELDRRVGLEPTNSLFRRHASVPSAGG